jgi:hypothetical protein
MPLHKISNVSDKVCEGCRQQWEDNCVAFNVPHTREEREYREQGYAKCLSSQRKQRHSRYEHTTREAAAHRGLQNL